MYFVKEKNLGVPTELCFVKETDLGALNTNLRFAREKDLGAHPENVKSNYYRLSNCHHHLEIN